MIYCVTGTLGSGKTLICIGRIFDAIQAGKRVATNLDLRLEQLTTGGGATDVRRLSDFPTLAELEALGTGNASTDESLNGVIVLDEAGTFLNARDWNSKDRHAVVSWLLHSRKLGWDVYLIVQDVSMLDRQIRVALVEHLVVCRRLDRVPIPFVGWFLKWTGLTGRFLRVHVGTVKYGTSAHSIVVERWMYRGNRFFAAYDTRQIFRPPSPEHLQGAYTLLDLYRAPWLKPPRSSALVELLWAAADRFALFAPLGRVLPRRRAGPWCDFLLASSR